VYSAQNILEKRKPRGIQKGSCGSGDGARIRLKDQFGTCWATDVPNEKSSDCRDWFPGKGGEFRMSEKGRTGKRTTDAPAGSSTATSG